ncbi:hypothetical protein [Desulfofundulus salinus]|uniref:Uncharacterized protein n=1 Tax=Desulfofundulus salinus TaxID=2419843 RepID=A0A494X4E1_9FIRM|nr:hypothetical protein [Desulfofundulus salinum]RKO67800.1 hypothetical protein D7024_13155 [Desulfofundulus salinum]
MGKARRRPGGGRTSYNNSYACGLIVSTALDYTKEFEEELEKVRAEFEFNRPVKVLLGKDIAYALVLDHMARQAEAR